MAFVHTINPRYAEIDIQGVVFNAHWLTYFDDASTWFFAHMGFDPKTTFTEHGEFDVMVVRAVLDWKGSARFGETVAIDVRPDRIGNASFDLRYTATAGGRPACEGVITYVSVKPGAKESAPIPGVLRDKLETEMG
jgi:acyl-CoA thioester hydrolase